MQNGFRLIVGRMRDDDTPGSMITGDLAQKLLTESPRPPLDSLPSHAIGLTHPQIAHHARNAEPCGQIGHESGVSRSLLPQIMPGVRDEQPRLCSLRLGQTVQAEQERHAVGASGDSHHHRR
jgi:hypothetical protein